MSMQLEMTGKVITRPSTSGHVREEYVCWSRMQAEAGQQLEAILARKELERRAGEGLFFWGVGNAPAVIANVLARAKVPVRIILSIMKSRPRMADVAPSRTVAWRRYVDAQGVDRLLPPHALVTSRGDNASGAKRAHYALICRSEEPLAIRRGQPFDPAAFRNAGGTGAPVGASQVTALLRRVAEDSGVSDYEANISAQLAEDYWVRLKDPVELEVSKLAQLSAAAEFDLAGWCEMVAWIRDGPSASDATKKRGSLL